MLAYIHTALGVSVLLNGRATSVSKDDPRYAPLIDALTDNASEGYLEELLAPPVQQVAAALHAQHLTGCVSIDEYNVYYKGQPVHNSLTVRMLDHLAANLPLAPLANFLEKLMQNPSFRAVQDLYGFLEYGKMPICPDGDFLAYKAIRSNWFDIHSGTFDNSVGQVVEIERNQVDEDPNRTCSNGLHVCSFEYLPSFSHADGHVVIVKINPKDVVAVPTDYNNTKMRVSRYQVVDEVDEYYGARRNILSETLVYDPSAGEDADGDGFTGDFDDEASGDYIGYAYESACAEFDDRPLITKAFYEWDDAVAWADRTLDSITPIVAVKSRFGDENRFFRVEL